MIDPGAEPDRQSLSSFLKSAALPFALVLVWMGLLGLVGSFSEALFFVLVLGVPVYGLILLILAIIWFVRGLQWGKGVSATRERVAAALASPVLLAATILLSLPASSVGGLAGDYLRLAINRPSYEAIARSVSAEGQHVSHEERNGIVFSVDRGPPVRIAFNPEGILDNWSAIIFDPTGEVMKADGFDPVSGKFVAPDRITKLFGGDLVGCRHLWGDYYKCSFT